MSKAEKIPVDIQYVGVKTVLIDGDFAQIKNNFASAIKIGSDMGTQFFICEKIVLQGGEEFILEKYDYKKRVITYRRSE